MFFLHIQTLLQLNGKGFFSYFTPKNDIPLFYIYMHIEIITEKGIVG